jgi:hypothetical protein
MKAIILIPTFLFSWLVFPGGGVDVGNGTKMLNYYSRDYDSEKEMITALDALRKEIVGKEDYRVANAINEGKCKDAPKVLSFDQIKKFNFKNNVFMPQEKFKAKIKVMFKNCDKTESMPNQIGDHY